MRVGGVVGPDTRGYWHALGLGHYTMADECLMKAKAIAIGLNELSVLGNMLWKGGVEEGGVT